MGFVQRYEGDIQDLWGALKELDIKEMCKDSARIFGEDRGDIQGFQIKCFNQSKLTITKLTTPSPNDKLILTIGLLSY